SGRSQVRILPGAPLLTANRTAHDRPRCGSNSRRFCAGRGRIAPALLPPFPPPSRALHPVVVFKACGFDPCFEVIHRLPPSLTSVHRMAVFLTCQSCLAVFSACRSLYTGAMANDPAAAEAILAFLNTL